MPPVGQRQTWGWRREKPPLTDPNDQPLATPKSSSAILSYAAKHPHAWKSLLYLTLLGFYVVLALSIGDLEKSAKAPLLAFVAAAGICIRLIPGARGPEHDTVLRDVLGSPQIMWPSKLPVYLVILGEAGDLIAGVIAGTASMLTALLWLHSGEAPNPYWGYVLPLIGICMLAVGIGLVFARSFRTLRDVSGSEGGVNDEGSET